MNIKNILNIKFALAAITIVSLTATSCRKDEQPEGTPGNIVIEDNHDHGGELSLHFDQVFDGAPFALNTNYEDEFGNTIYFTRVSTYLSQPKLMDMSMDVIADFDSVYAFVTETTDHWNIGSIEEGHVHNIDFGIGVDSAANHDDPMLYDVNHPLAPKNPSAHWGWNTGYKFIILEGQVDTDNDGTPETLFSYHTGTDDLLRIGSLDLHTDVDHDSDLMINVTLDYSKFFTGIDMSVDNFTHTNGNLPLATQVADNAPSAFIVQ